MKEILEQNLQTGSYELRMKRPVVWSETPPFPHNMLMELANICNHKCAFCGYRDMKRKKRVCEKKLMFDVLAQAFKNGTREVGFYLIGEPFMCKDLVEYIICAKDLGYEYIYLTTNGVLAMVDRCVDLITAGLNSIKFSVNAATRETYLSVHGRDDFNTVVQNITALKKYKVAHGIELPMFISFVRNELNKDDIPQLYEKFGALVDEIYIYPCLNQGGRMHTLIDSGIIKKKDFFPGSTAPCEICFNTLHITCEGYLNACCADVDGYLSAVDLYECSLYDAWNSEVMMRLRRRHLQNELKGLLCYNCVNNTEEPFFPLNEKLMSECMQ